MENGSVSLATLKSMLDEGEWLTGDSGCLKSQKELPVLTERKARWTPETLEKRKFREE